MVEADKGESVMSYEARVRERLEAFIAEVREGITRESVRVGRQGGRMEHRGNDRCGYCGKRVTPSAYQRANKARGHATYCTWACMRTADRARQQAQWAWEGIEIGHCGRWHQVRGVPVVCAVCGVVILDNDIRGGVDDEAGAGSPV